MTTKTKHADDEQLRALLWADEESGEFQTAAAHVDGCESCRTRLDELSGSQAIDDETRELLSRYPWDSHSSGHGLRAPQSAADIDRELDFLGPASHPELLGRLGRYEVERVIGKGGMGIVLKAYDTDLNRPVAVKVLAKHLAHSGAARQRFARESRAAAAVVHEHVVAIHNVETEGDVPFLVMQFVSGESLQSRVDRDGPLSAKEILRIGIQVAAGLSAAHEQGVIHRDVKPANILLENGVERVLLTDFGLARTVDDASLTQTGVIAGTPHYMSPEQSDGLQSDHRTDLFSLGSVLYFMATGHPPFRAERAMGVLNRICHDRQKPLWQVNRDVPDELSVLVDRLLEKRPSRRVPSGESAREQLLKLLAQLQQPRTGVLRHVRRVMMRYPRRLLAAVLLVAIVVASSLAFDLWQEGASEVATGQQHTASNPSSASGEFKTLSSLTEQDFDAFRRTVDNLRERLDAINDFGSYKIDLQTEETDQPPLQSLHQRLERLQSDETTESQFNHSEDKR